MPIPDWQQWSFSSYNKYRQYTIPITAKARNVQNI